MKDYKTYIFDLDYTLLIPDWSSEDEYLKNYIAIEEQEEFFKQKQEILDKFEALYPRYDLKELSLFFKSHGFNVSDKIIRMWLIHNGDAIIDEVVDGVVDLFEYLKANNKEIVVLTNWFGGTQIPRLKRAGLYDYIDRVVTGDQAMKPGIKSFELAIGDTNKEDCVMIGDSISSDKKGADNVGIDSYILGKDLTMRDLYNNIKNSKEKIKQL